MYADNVIIILENKKCLKKSKKELIKKAKDIDLNINEAKIKYLILFRQQNRARKLELKDFTFETVEHFKYL